MLISTEMFSGRHIILATTYCKAFLGRRRGAESCERCRYADRRDGGLKMDWTKPLHDARAMGIESAGEPWTKGNNPVQERGF
jgi:hypothetical protein